MSDFSVDLKGKAAIISGAGAGTGKAIALALAASGATVAVNDINPDRAAAVAEVITRAGGRAFDFHGDMSNRFQAAALIEQARHVYGRIHIMVNTAGVYKPEPLVKVDEWDWRRQLDVNLTGTFFCTQLIGRVMSDEGGGVIINLSSNLWDRTLPDGGVGYVATKAGIVAMTRQAARELAPANVRVNTVSTGSIDETDSPASLSNMLNRIESPEAVTGLVLFLCSDAASFITGQVINVDGGLL